MNAAYLIINDADAESYPVGRELAAEPRRIAADGQIARLATRTANADGSPRADLVRFRVVRVEREKRRLTAQAIEDGALPVARVTCEVAL